MMGDRPDDIPQAVWEKATKAWLSSDTRTIARIILDATAAEREACAEIAKTHRNPYMGGARGVAQEQGKAIAAAILKRGEQP